MKTIHIFYFIICIFITSCTPKFIVEVDSLCVPTAKEKTSYVLVPGNKDCSKLDLQYIEFERYTDRVLQDLGYTKASEHEQGQVLVMLYYGISDPQLHEYTYSLPIYGQTGIASSSTYGNINAYSNGASYSSTTSYTPSYGVIGSSTHVGIEVLFKSYVTLIAMDIDHYQLTNESKTLWQTNITSIGETGDLRKLFPILLGGAKDHIATDTGQIVTIKLKEKDDRVLSVKGTLKPKKPIKTTKDLFESSNLLFSDLKTRIETFQLRR